MKDLSKYFGIKGITPLELESFDEGRKLLLHEESTVSIWGGEDKLELLGRISVSRNLTSVLIHPEGRYVLLTFTKENRGEVWSLESFQIQSRLDAGNFKSLEIHKKCNSSCGNYILIAGFDRIYRFPWEGTGNMVPKDEIVLDTHIEFGIAGISAQPFGNKLIIALGEEDGSITFMLEEDGNWNNNEAFKEAIRSIDEFELLTFSPFGRFMQTNFRYENTILDAENFEVAFDYRVMDHPSNASKTKFFQKDDLLCWLNANALIELNTQTGAKRTVFQEEEDVLDYIWTPSGIYYATIGEYYEGEFKTRLHFHPHKKP